MVILRAMEGRFWGLDHNEGFEGFVYSPVSRIKNGEWNSR